MKVKQITYEKVKSCNFNNEKIGIVLEVEPNEKAEDVFKKAKMFVDKQFGEVVMVPLREEDIPF